MCRRVECVKCETWRINTTFHAHDVSYSSQSLTAVRVVWYSYS